MTPRSEDEVLALLRARGAVRLRRVRFRANRSTIWSLTQGGTALNLHLAYRTAPVEILVQFAVIVMKAGDRGTGYLAAASAVRGWEGLSPALGRIRREKRGRRSPGRTGVRGPCCATDAQLDYLRRLYRHLNRTRFEGRLPPDIPLRLSSRMRSRIGQMVPGMKQGARQVVEIALNLDLMLEGNGAARVETLVHEMAHAAHWLFEGGRGHGPGWRRWARHAGCEARACVRGVIHRRARGVRRVTRVPPLPQS